MKRYTVGFILRNNCKEVLLLHPKRPEWQVGQLNGPGGRVEEGETIVRCMVRETEEETGLKTEEGDWIFIDVEKDGENEIHFLTCKYQEQMGEVEQKTDEELEWLPTNPLPEKVIENLNWLIPKGIEKIK